MNFNKFLLLSISIFISSPVFTQEDQSKNKQEGHYNTNKFRQMYQEFSSPNMFRTAAGAPGPAYYQQQADYVIEIELDDKNKRIYGEETITYTNNSPDNLEYLWVQLDQNVRKKDSPSLQIDGNGVRPFYRPSGFTSQFLDEPFDGGFNIDYVRDINGKPLNHVVNQTMMRIDLPKAMSNGEKFSFSIKWWYNIQDHVNQDGRSGYETFPSDGNRSYIIAQFFPRMAVYNEVEGWQNYQFWGNGEFALEFGDYQVNITVPSDHILEATGSLQNAKEVLSKKEYDRFQNSTKSFNEPVIIVNQEEAGLVDKA